MNGLMLRRSALMSSVGPSEAKYVASDFLDPSKPSGDVYSSTYWVNGQYSRMVGLSRRTGIQKVTIENSPWIEEQFASYSSITVFTGYKTRSIAGNAFQNCSSLAIVDLGGTPGTAGALTSSCFAGASALATIILRAAEIPSLTLNAFNSTHFKQGGTGGDIFINHDLYLHLGDGSSLDYKAVGNWATVDGWGTIAWHDIKGSVYEYNYADGSPVPTT